MGILSRRVEAGLVHHPEDAAACAEYLQALGHPVRAEQFVACWRRRTTRLLAAAAIRRATPDDARLRIPEPLLAECRVVVGLESAPAALPRAVFRYGLAEDVPLWIWTVPPRRVPQAVRLGFRPFAAPEPFPGPSSVARAVPMVCVTHDLTHLQAVRSPFADQLVRSRAPLRTDAVTWLATLARTPAPAPTAPQGAQDIDWTEELERPRLAGSR